MSGVKGMRHTVVHRKRPPSAAEQKRREAWGKMAGAKVAAAYKALTERE